MFLVPIHAAAVYAVAACPELGARLPAAAVRLGERVEIDTDLLPEGAALASWWTSCEQLWAAARDGDLEGRDWIRTRRTLVEARQSTTKGAKVDLNAEYEALADIAVVGDLVAEVTGPDPAPVRCRALASAHGGTFTQPGPAEAVCTFTVSGSPLFPNLLGGPLWAGEVLRTFTLDLRYAAWRDRRVRRLAGVQVSVDELWAPVPEPTHR